MNSHRRRAYSLVHLIALLPLIAAVSTTALLLADRVLYVQGHEQRHLQADAAARDLVRRLENDVRQARSATVRSEEGTCELQLVAPGGTITYRASGERVSRTEAAADKTPVSFAWTLPQSLVEFRVEQISGSPRLVWATFVLHTVSDSAGLRRTWRLSAGGPINQGSLP